MRIFYASDTSANPWMLSIHSQVWRNNLLLPLRDLGHDVVELAYDLGPTFRNLDPAIPAQAAFIARNRPIVSVEILRQITAAHAQKPIDLFFSYLYDACILPQHIDAIKLLGIRTVNWYCNGSYQLHLVKEISPHYDYCLVPEKFRLPDYRAMGARPIYCQEAANPNIYKPFPLPQEFDVTFIGQAYGDRPAYIHHLLNSGINIRAWGHNWLPHPKVPPAPNSPHDLLLQNHPHILGPALSDTEMIQMYSRSKINLGFSTCGDTHTAATRILQIRLRDFEVPMSGGFYMVEYMEELEEFFHIGKEIICYHNKEDLTEKIRYYLTHDHERAQIRRAGHARALKDHTWQKRLADSFAKMT
jgi:spore maturation protein CgeB